MDVEGTFATSKSNVEQPTVEEMEGYVGNVWQFRKKMIQDLLTPLICVTQSTSSDVEIKKSHANKCNIILEDVVSKVVNYLFNFFLG